MVDTRCRVILSEDEIKILVSKLNRIAENRSRNAAAILKKGSVGDEQINQIIIIVFAIEGDSDLDRADWISNSVIVSLSRTSLKMLQVSMQRRERPLILTVGDIEVTAVKTPEVKPKIMRSLTVQNEIHTLH